MSRCPGRLFRIVLLGFLVWMCQDAARAQSSQAMLLGRVTQEATGAPIAKALVIQRNLQTNVQSYRYTNEQGLYSFPALQPGSYSIRVDALGFQPEERSPVELPVAARLELNFAVKGGAAPPTAPATPAAALAGAAPSKILALMYGADAAVPQAVMISLPAQATETIVATVSNVIDERKIMELPLSGRDVYTLLVLQPGVTSDGATARGLGFSVNGQRVSSSNFLLDGVDNNDLLVTGPAARVSADAIKEYRMATNSFAAEYGRSSGFIANAITRSGTNSLHGTLYEFFQHDRLSANTFTNNWQGLPRAPFRQNQFGGSVGGPVQNDRLFFFGNFEQFRQSSECRFFGCFAPGLPANEARQELELLVPSQQVVDGLFEGSLSKELLTRFPPPEGEPIPGISSVVRYKLALPLVQWNTFALGRLDYSTADGRHRFSGRYAFSQRTTDDFSDIGVYPNQNAPLVFRGQNLVANYTRELAGGSNELKFGFSRNRTRLLRPNPEIPLHLSADRVELPGSQAATDFLFRDTVFHIVDNYSRLSGKHALGMGFEWRPARHESLLSLGRDGFYAFNSLFDFQFDNPFFLFFSLNRQTGLPAADDDYRRSYRQNEFAAFFQDNWKLTPRLTLNLGLRYEYFGPPAARKATRDFNFVFGSGQNIGERIANGQLETGPIFRADRNNFAPRFGFALDLFGHGSSVLRGGYGLFYDRVFNNIWQDVRLNTLTFGTLLNVPGLPLQFRYTFPASDGVLPPEQLPPPQTTVAVDRGLRTPYSQIWFLGYQQEITPNFLVEVNHTGSLGRKLLTGDWINRAFSVPVEEKPVGFYNPDLPNISDRANQGHSDYVALGVGLNRRWSKGVQFQVSYTYSRTRDVQSDPLGRRGGGTGRRGSLVDTDAFSLPPSSFTRQFDPSADYGRSDFDQPHNLVFNVVAETPKFHGWRRLLGGWQVATIAGFRSGFPFSVISDETFFPESGGLLVFNRADFLGQDPDEAFLPNRPHIPDGGGGVVLFDRAKFEAPADGKIGNVPRNAFRGPGFWNMDFSFSRSFGLPRLGEQGRLQFRAEFFNLFNHTNLNNPELSLGCIRSGESGGQVPCFGEATFGRQGFGSSVPGASPLVEQPRRIQFGLKIYF